MQINRRELLAAGLSLSSGMLLPVLSKPARASDGFLEIVAEQKPINILPTKPPSDLWVYNGKSPGSEIRVKKGERVKVRFTNKLPEPTSIHWHGIRIANNMDGVSGLTQKAVEPGEVFEYDFEVPDAGTYWYHAHNKSWNQVARGLYGALIVDEKEEEFPPEQDITLVVDDWRLDQQGLLDTASIGAFMDWSHAGRLGNYLTVNGASRPDIKMKAGVAYRVRFINASNSRVLEIDPNRFGAKVIAYDGQALPEPTKLSYTPLLIGPAQRVDFLMEPKKEEALEIEELSGKSPYNFAYLNISGQGGGDLVAPSLVANSIPEPDLETARTIPLNMTGGAMAPLGDAVYQGQKLEGELFRQTQQVWAFNGVANLADEPLFRARRGETIIVETANRTAFLHAMHVHGHHFRIINRSESELDEGKPWRDTFLIGPGQVTKIAFVADNPGKWLLHCHMLEHAAAGMNTWFEIS